MNAFEYRAPRALDEALAVLRDTDEQRVGRAIRAIRLHVPLGILGRQVCRNCGWPAPCATRRLAERVLRATGLDFLIPQHGGGGPGGSV